MSIAPYDNEPLKLSHKLVGLSALILLFAIVPGDWQYWIWMTGIGTAVIGAAVAIYEFMVES